MPRLEDLLVQIHVGKHAVEGHAVGPGGDDLADGPGGGDAHWGQPDDLSGVPPDLVGRVAVQPDQLQVRLVPDPSDHLGTDVAGRDLEHPDLAVAHFTHDQPRPFTSPEPLGSGRRAPTRAGPRGPVVARCPRNCIMDPLGFPVTDVTDRSCPGRDRDRGRGRGRGRAGKGAGAGAGPGAGDGGPAAGRPRYRGAVRDGARWRGTVPSIPLRRALLCGVAVLGTACGGAAQTTHPSTSGPSTSSSVTTRPTTTSRPSPPSDLPRVVTAGRLTFDLPSSWTVGYGTCRCGWGEPGTATLGQRPADPVGAVLLPHGERHRPVRPAPLRRERGARDRRPPDGHQRGAGTGDTGPVDRDAVRYFPRRGPVDLDRSRPPVDVRRGHRPADRPGATDPGDGGGRPRQSGEGGGWRDGA